MKSHPTIIPIAGGKGGVGKSLLAANLSIALSQLGRSTVVVDLDFGGSNLYSFLGLHNTNRGIGDYLHDKGIGFEELKIQTEWPRLEFIPGDGQIPFMANLSFTQKLKIIRSIKEISADFVILDLGAGATFNTLDFFRISKRGLIITSPERVAQMNMLVFLKHLIFRVIDRSVPKKGQIRSLVNSYYKMAVNEEQTTIHSLIDQIREIDQPLAQGVLDLCAAYSPRIVYNMVQHPEKLPDLGGISQLAAKALLLEIDHFGVVFQDNEVIESIERGVPLLKHSPECPSARSIRILAGRIAQMWDDNLENSEHKLLINTRRLHEKLFPAL